MATIRLYYGRNNDEMVHRLQEARRAKREISTIEVRETVLDEDVIEEIVCLLQQRTIDTVQLDDCGAYLNKQAISMARALGERVKNVRLSEPTFLTQYFLDSLLVGATGLQSLRIQDHLDCHQIKALGTGLKSNTSLMTLDLSRSRLDSFSILADSLESNTCLRQIKLRSLGLGDGHVGQILSSLSHHPTLISIDLSFNHCRESDYIGHFINTQATTIATTTKTIGVQELHLGYQNVWQGPKFDIGGLAEAMKTNSTLTALSLSRNKLTDDDAIILAAALQTNRTLEFLDLRENKIGDDGAIAIAQVAQQYTTTSLRKINLLKNLFGERGVNAFLASVHQNVNLIQVELPRCQLVCSRLVEQIQYVTALNMGGRKFLFNKPMLALWPIIFERVNHLDWEDFSVGTCDFFATEKRHAYIPDVLFYLLRGPAIFEGVVCDKP